MLWEQYIAWTKMFIISLIVDLPNDNLLKQPMLATRKQRQMPKTLSTFTAAKVLITS